jgi:hypothetical protein
MRQQDRMSACAPHPRIAALPDRRAAPARAAFRDDGGARLTSSPLRRSLRPPTVFISSSL